MGFYLNKLNFDYDKLNISDTYIDIKYNNKII